MRTPSRTRTVALSIVLLYTASGAASQSPSAPVVEVMVYAASSLKEVLGTIGPICEKQAGARLVHNFGASNDLARQIVAANKADIFFSADEAWMDHVAGAGLVEPASRRALLSNRLVVVVPAESSIVLRSVADLARDAVKRVALANPAAVPAGRYAKAWLEMAGVWGKVAGKVVPAPDVRAAVAMVEAGAADAGIVYRTDAAIARRARVAFVAPADDGPRIAYPVAALRERPHVGAARRAIECYAGPVARDLFERAGFIVLDAGTTSGAPAAPR